MKSVCMCFHLCPQKPSRLITSGRLHRGQRPAPCLYPRRDVSYPIVGLKRTVLRDELNRREVREKGAPVRSEGKSEKTNGANEARRDETKS